MSKPIKKSTVLKGVASALSALGLVAMAYPAYQSKQRYNDSVRIFTTPPTGGNLHDPVEKQMKDPLSGSEMKQIDPNLKIIAYHDLNR